MAPSIDDDSYYTDPVEAVRYGYDKARQRRLAKSSPAIDDDLVQAAPQPREKPPNIDDAPEPSFLSKLGTQVGNFFRAPFQTQPSIDDSIPTQDETTQRDRIGTDRVADQELAAKTGVSPDVVAKFREDHPVVSAVERGARSIEEPVSEFLGKQKREVVDPAAAFYSDVAVTPKGQAYRSLRPDIAPETVGQLGGGSIEDVALAHGIGPKTAAAAGAVGGAGLDIASDPVTWELSLLGKTARAGKVGGATEQAARVGRVAGAVEKGAGTVLLPGMVTGAVQSGLRAKEIGDERGYTSPEFSRAVGEATVPAIMAGIAAYHAVRDVAAQPAQPVRPEQAPQAAAPTPEAVEATAQHIHAGGSPEDVGLPAEAVPVKPAEAPALRAEPDAALQDRLAKLQQELPQASDATLAELEKEHQTQNVPEGAALIRTEIERRAQAAPGPSVEEAAQHLAAGGKPEEIGLPPEATPEAPQTSGRRVMDEGRRLYDQLLEDDPNATPEQLREELKRVRAEGNTDPQTGVGSRAAYVRDTMPGRPKPAFVSEVDLAGVGATNSMFGEPVADAIIKTGGEVMKEAVGDHGKVYRKGGDEFVVHWNSPEEAAAGAPIIKHYFDRAVVEFSKPDGTKAYWQGIDHYLGHGDTFEDASREVYAKKPHEGDVQYKKLPVGLEARVREALDVQSVPAGETGVRSGAGEGAEAVLPGAAEGGGLAPAPHQAVGELGPGAPAEPGVPNPETIAHGPQEVPAEEAAPARAADARQVPPAARSAREEASERSATAAPVPTGPPTQLERSDLRDYARNLEQQIRTRPEFPDRDAEHGGINGKHDLTVHDPAELLNHESWEDARKDWQRLSNDSEPARSHIEGTFLEPLTREFRKPIRTMDAVKAIIRQKGALYQRIVRAYRENLAAEAEAQRAEMEDDALGEKRRPYAGQMGLPGIGQGVGASPKDRGVAWGEKDEKTGRKFSSTQVELPNAIQLKLKAIESKIPKNEISSEDGTDHDTTDHITAKFGLHTNDEQTVRDAVAGIGPVRVRLGKTSLFPAKEGRNYDVLKADVDSPDLHRLNAALARAIPNTDTNPEYKPHATIAYLKPGEGEKYVGDSSVAGAETTLDRLTFSTRDGKKITIPLRGGPPKQQTMFGGQLLTPTERNVPEGREAAGPLFQQEQERAAKVEAGRQATLPAEDHNKILKTIPGEEGMEVHITRGEKGYHATLWDSDAQRGFVTHIFPTMEAAEAGARKMVPADVVREPETRYLPSGDKYEPATDRAEAKRQAYDAAKQLGLDFGRPGGKRPVPDVPALRGIDAGSGVRTISLGITIPKELQNRGWIDLRGQRVSTPQDLAVLANVYRDPRYETFRVFYTKGDRIVAHEAVTSRLPDTVKVADGVKTYAEIRDRMKRADADGYWLLHNHPSGEPGPSRADIAASDRMAQMVPGYKGHVIIDGQTFGFIGERQRGGVTGEIPAWVAGLPKELRSVEPYLVPSEGDTTVRKVESPKDLAAVGSAMRSGTPNDYVTLIHTSANGLVRGVQEMPSALFVRPEAADYIRGQQRAIGAGRTFAYHPGQQEIGFRTEPYLGAAEQLLHDGVITDAIMGGRSSLTQLGSIPRAKPPAAGRFRVAEEPEAPKSALKPIPPGAVPGERVAETKSAYEPEEPKEPGKAEDLTSRLQALGIPQDRIDKMTPAEAWGAIRGPAPGVRDSSARREAQAPPLYPSPIPEGTRATGEPPRVETNAKTLRAEEIAAGVTDRTVRGISPERARDTPQTQADLDFQRAKGKLRAEPDEYFYNKMKRGRLEPAESQEWDARVQGKGIAVQKANDALNEAMQAGNKDAIPRLMQEKLVAELDRIAAKRAYLDDGTGLARALAARSKIQKEAPTNSDTFLKHLFKQIPDITDARAAELSDIFMNHPQALAESVRVALNPSTRIKLLEGWKMGMLGLASMIKKGLVGDPMAQALNLWQNIAGTAIERGKAKLSGRDADREWAETYAHLRALKETLPAVVGHVADRIRNEAFDPTGSNWEGSVGAIGKGGRAAKALGKLTGTDVNLGKVIRTPGRVMEGFTEGFGQVSGRVELYRQAARRAMQESRIKGLQGDARTKFVSDRAAQIERDVMDGDPDNKYGSIIDSMKQKAKYFTYASDLGKFAEKVNAVRATDSAAGIAVNTQLPFFKTPWNIEKMMMEHTPLNAGRLAYKAWKGELKGGAAAEEWAKPILGSAVMAMAFAAAKQGLITGAGTVDQNAEKYKEQTGWQPYSLNTPLGYLSYHAVPIFGPLAGMVADSVEAKGEPTTKEAAQRVVSSVVQNVLNESFWKGIHDASAFMFDPMRYGSTWTKGMLGSVVPSGVASMARAVDTTKRETKATDLSAIKARIPFLSRTLPEAKLGTGEGELRPDAGFGKAGDIYNAISPFPLSRPREGRDLEKEFSEIGFAPRPVRESVTVRDPTRQDRNASIDLNEDEIGIQNQARQKATEEADRLVHSSEYRNMSDPQRVYLLKGIYARYERAAAQQIMPGLQRRARETRP